MLSASRGVKDLLIELLGELTVSSIRSTNRRWRGWRPSERLIERMMEQELLEQIEAENIARLLGTRDYVRIA